MDAFFVEVERKRSPALMGKAVVVGGAGPRGVVASASYEARARGVTSAMPMGRALRMCPHAVVVPPDHGAYATESRGVFEVLAEFSPEIEKVSIDEAFVDITGLRLHYESPEAVGTAIHRRVAEATGLPCSVGLASTKLLAKMASRDAKPGGVLLIPSGTEREYLAAKPVRSLWGVGEATHARLEELGVETIGDLAAFPKSTLIRRLGDSLGTMLSDLAAGVDPRPVEGADPVRTISVERTYDVDLSDRGAIEAELLAHSERLAMRLRRAGYVATTITLKVRYGDFSTVTRSRTHPEPLSSTAEIHTAARQLLARTEVGTRPVRLLGIGADGLASSGEPRQLGMDRPAWDEVEDAVEGVRSRFGDDAVGQPHSWTVAGEIVIKSNNCRSVYCGFRPAGELDAPRRQRTAHPRRDRAAVLPGGPQARRVRA
jgi:DNA polymerase-4